MRFSTLSILGLSSIIGTRSKQDEQHYRNLKNKVRAPRIHKTDIILDLQSQLAAAVTQISTLQATITAFQSNATASSAIIAALKGNITESSATIKLLPSRQTLQLL